MHMKDLVTYSVIRRNGEVVAWAPEKIAAAVARAFILDAAGVRTRQGECHDRAGGRCPDRA